VLGALRAILTAGGQELPKPAEKNFIREGEILRERWLRGMRHCGNWQQRYVGWIDHSAPALFAGEPLNSADSPGVSDFFADAWPRPERHSSS